MLKRSGVYPAARRKNTRTMISSAHSTGKEARQFELEIIVCSLDDALAAYEGGAARLEVTIRLDQAGLTPPLELVERVVQRVPIPARIMLREKADFVLGGKEELFALQRAAQVFAALNVDGLVTGYVKDGRLDVEALGEIFAAAPSLRYTVHHAIEMTTHPSEALQALRSFTNVDRALVSGGSGTLPERIERLATYQRALGPGQCLVAGGNLSVEMLPLLRKNTSIRVFHLGRAVRTPEQPWGMVDVKKVKKAREQLGDAEAGGPM